jgi:hypothetical protein
VHSFRGLLANGHCAIRAAIRTCAAYCDHLRATRFRQDRTHDGDFDGPVIDTRRSPREGHEPNTARLQLRWKQSRPHRSPEIPVAVTKAVTGDPLFGACCHGMQRHSETRCLRAAWRPLPGTKVPQISRCGELHRFSGRNSIQMQSLEFRRKIRRNLSSQFESYSWTQVSTPSSELSTSSVYPHQYEH